MVGDVAVTTFFVKKSDACDEGAAMRIRAIAARRHPSLIRGLVEFLVPRGVCTQTPRGFELSDVTVGVARPEVVLTVLGSDTRRFGADTWLSTATRCPLASVLAWSHTSRLVPRRRRGSYTRVATGCGAKPRHDVFAREASSRNRAGSQRPSSPRSAREEHGRVREPTCYRSRSSSRRSRSTPSSSSCRHRDADDWLTGSCRTSCSLGPRASRRACGSPTSFSVPRVEDSKHEKQNRRQLVSTPTAFEDNAHLIGRTVWELLKEHDLKRMA